MAASPTAQLNAMATPRRRGRPQGSTSVPSRKRRMVGDLWEVDQHIQDLMVPATTTSVVDSPAYNTRLKRRSMPTSSDLPDDRRNRYDFPSSPQAQQRIRAGNTENHVGTVSQRIIEVLPHRVDDEPAGKSVSRRLGGKSRTRLLNQRTTKDGPDPFDGRQFGSLQEQESGAILTSLNTPARPQRPRPSKKSKQLHVVVEEPDQRHSVLPRRTDTAEADGRSGPGQLESAARNSQGEGLQFQGRVWNTPQAQESSPSPNEQQEATHETDTDVKNANVTSTNSVSGSAAATRNTSSAAGNDQPVSKTNHDPGRRSARKRRRSMSEEVDMSHIDSPTDNPDEADSRNDQFDNSDRDETDEARADKIRRANFMADIEECSNTLGIASSLAKVGAAALKIKQDLSQPKADEQRLRTPRSTSVWRRLAVLKSLYATTTPDREELTAAINKLARVSARRKLQKVEGEQSRGDACVLDLFHYTIPRSVELIRRALLAHRRSTFPAPLSREILSLVEIAYDMSDTALEWIPKPTSLTGLRGYVHSSIRPGLREIRQVMKIRLENLEMQAKARQMNRDLRQSQQARLAELKRLHQQIATQSQYQSIWSSSASRPQPQRQQQGEPGPGPEPEPDDDVVDIDEIPESDHENSPPLFHVDRTRIPAPRSRRLARQNTAEIPAPDPSTTWTDRESKFLIDGLMRHTGPDRFETIAAIPALRRKDIDQIVAMSRRLKEICTHMVQVYRERGDGKYAWLASVP